MKLVLADVSQALSLLWYKMQTGVDLADQHTFLSHLVTLHLAMPFLSGMHTTLSLKAACLRVIVPLIQAIDTSNQYAGTGWMP